MWSSIGFHSSMFSAKFCWSEGKKRWKCEKLKTDIRQTTGDQKSFLELSVHVCAVGFFKISFNFLAKNSSELFWSSVSLSVCLYVISSSTPVPLGQFQPNLAQSIFGQREFTFIQMRGHAVSGGDNLDILVRINCQLLKILFFRTTQPILTKFCTQHSYVTGIKVCLNEGPHSFPILRGDYNEQYFKIFCRTDGPISTWLDPTHSWVKWRAQFSFQGEIITK